MQEKQALISEMGHEVRTRAGDEASLYGTSISHLIKTRGDMSKAVFYGALKTDMRISTLFRIAKILDVPASDLVAAVEARLNG